MGTDKNSKKQCAWCGSTDVGLRETRSGSPVMMCDDWAACAEREKKLKEVPPPEQISTPWRRRSEYRG